jgi:hypothetical protein
MTRTFLTSRYKTVYTEFFKQVKQFLPIALQPSIIIIPINIFLSIRPPFLSNKSLIRRKLKSESIHELIILFEISVVAEIENDLVDMIYDRYCGLYPCG